MQKIAIMKRIMRCGNDSSNRKGLLVFPSINFIAIVGFLETIGNGCLSLFEDISSMCCSVIGIVGIVSVIVVLLYFRKKKREDDV